MSPRGIGRVAVSAMAFMALTVLAAPPAPAKRSPLTVAWWAGEKTHSVSSAARHAPQPSQLRTPLGSVWKLFVYSYVVAQGQDAPPYRCAAQRPARDDEMYCCEPGEAVERDEALARSCGPFFEPARLQLDAAQWQSFWQQHGAPAWLLSLSAMQPATTVRVEELLKALAQVPPSARTAARQALLSNTTRDAQFMEALGSGPRFKTWSWTDAQGHRIGGAAGWLADASPFWLSAAGTSRQVLSAHASELAQAFHVDRRLTAWPDASSLDADPCVSVQMFARYPLRAVLQDHAGAANAPAAAGPMQGRYQLHFVNGQSLRIQATRELQLSMVNGQPRIDARLGLEDYVARVVDREGDAREVPAARALAVAARTWLLHNTAQSAGCRVVADSSQTQRVSPNAATAGARAATAFTQGLVLTGMPVRYHQDDESLGVLGWTQAVRAGREGRGFTEILQHAFPRASFASAGGASDCVAVPQAQAWLASREAKWREILRQEAGFEPAAATLQVCQLSFGAPHADARRMQLRVREWHSREGRVSLVHEYLHLAFRHHSRGADELFVERLAQRLADL